MTKTICDICGKDMPSAKNIDTIENLNFCISSYGRIWDIRPECRGVDPNRWMTIRRKESEGYHPKGGATDEHEHHNTRAQQENI